MSTRSEHMMADALADVLPSEALTSPDAASGWSVGGARPEAVVFPSDVEGVRAVLATAAREGFGVVPLGRRTDPGCEAPRGSFVVLATERLAGVEAYEPADLTATAKAGTGIADLAAAFAPNRQWLPFDPPHAMHRTLGGLVATGAWGPLALRYGGPRDLVLGVDVVTGEGRLLRLGGRVMKNVAGFDLVRAMVGSRGTLGVIVSGTVRLFPRPEEDRVLVARGSTAEALFGAARAVATARVLPASAVLTEFGRDGVSRRGALLAVRLHGAPSALDSEERILVEGIGHPVERLRGDDAGIFSSELSDLGGEGGVVITASTRPATLADAFVAVRSAFPAASLVADILTGKLRAVMPGVSTLRAETLIGLRRGMERLDGSLTLEAAPSDLVRDVGAYAPRLAERRLALALRQRFDPAGVLSPGRFVT